MDCPRLKKEKRQKLEANFTQVDDGTDSDSSVLSLYSPTSCYSKETEQIFLTGATYHVCTKQEWFVSLKNQMEALCRSMTDTHASCQIEGIRTVHIKLFDGMVRELKDVRYVPKLKNLISFGVLETHGLIGTLGEGVLKMSSGSLVILKSIRHNNLCYLKCSAVSKNFATSEHLEDDTIRFWQMGLEQVDMGFFASFGDTRSIERCIDLQFKIE